MDKFNECKEYVNFETDALLVVLALKYFGMKSLEDTPEAVIPPAVMKYKKEMKIEWLYNHVQKMIEQYIAEPQSKSFATIVDDATESA